MSTEGKIVKNMKIKNIILLLFLENLMLSSTMGSMFAQEIENNADEFLKEYSDTFQDNFFEALKQKGIDNHDKAIQLFLNCKRIDPDNKVIDFELAKAYRETKELSLAQEYAINAVNSNPENFWYLHTLITILDINYTIFNQIASEIPSKNIGLQQNLALIYYQMQKYQNALEIINGLKSSSFTAGLSPKIKEAIKQQEADSETTKVSEEPLSTEKSAIIDYKTTIANLIQSENFLILDTVSNDALSNYPTQPYFYYARGFVLNKKNKYQDAAKVLEEALDYLLDDIPLANKIYQELSKTYFGLNNPVKANKYLEKIKP